MPMDQKQSRGYFETPSLIAHKRERLTRILLPIIIAAVLVLFLMVYLSVYSNRLMPSLGVLSAVAAVFLAIIFIFFALIKLALLSLGIFGLEKLKPYIPRAGLAILQGSEKVRWYIRKSADISVQPIISLNEGAQKIKQVRRSLEARFLEKGSGE